MSTEDRSTDGDPAELTERLRPLQETETDDLMQKVTEEYNRTVKAIEDFQNA